MAYVEELSPYTGIASSLITNGKATSVEKYQPSFGDVGTGGFCGLDFPTARRGYKSAVVIIVKNSVQPTSCTPYQELMEEIKKGFGRTFSHLPVIFGVSRQTLYNWRSGETPKQQHQEKLVQLAEASCVFINAGFKPDPLSLDRVLLKGKSFITLLSEGSNGKEMAERLIRLVKRGKASLENLESLVENKRAHPLTVADMGRPLFKEDI